MPVIEGFTERTAPRAGGPIEGFRPTIISDLKPPSGSRSALGFANDTIVTGVNSALGIGKAVSDFVSVDNPVSRGLQWLIDEGEQTYTPQTRAAREELNRAIDAGGWDAAGGVGEFVLTSPVQAAAMAAGNFGPFGAVIKGARGLAALGGLGAKGVSRTGIGAASVLGGAAAGGDAAGDAYEQVMRSPNVDPTMREELARRAAREASVVPAIIGAATPFLPGSAESQLARGLGITRASIPRAAASEFGQEFIEEGATKLSANLAAKQYDPTIDASRGVLGSSLLGGVLGAGTGAGVTYLNNRAVEADLLRLDQARAAKRQEEERVRQERLAPILGMIRPGSSVGPQALIDQQLGISPALSDKEIERQRKAREADIMAAFDAPSGVRVPGEGGIERELTSYERMLQEQGLSPEQVVPGATPPAAPSKVFSAEEQELISMGVTPNGKALELLSEIKASGLPVDSLAPVITAMAERKNAQAKKLLAQAIIESRKPAPAAAAAPEAPVVVAPVAPPVGATAASVAEAPGATSLPVPEVPANVQASQAQQAEAPGEAPLAAAPAQGAPAADAAAPVAHAAQSGTYTVADAISADGPVEETVRLIVRPDGTSAILRGDGNLIDVTNMVRAGFSAERAIAQAIGHDTSGANVKAATESAAPPVAPTTPVVQRKVRRVVDPAALQQSQAFVAPEPTEEQAAPADPNVAAWEDSKPDDAPALATLTPALQQVWAQAVAAKAEGRRINLFKVAEDIVAEQGDETTGDDTLATLNQIFGERDAAMLYDRYVDNMTEEAIANKYGLARQTVAKVTGEGSLGQKTRATKIRNAQQKFGWSDEYVQQLAARLSPAQAEVEAAPTSGRTGVDLEATESAFGADTAPEMGGRDPSLREAGFSTSASLGGSVSNWRDSGELAGRKNITQADQDKLDELYARRAAAEEAGNDSEVESADAEISMVEAKYLSPSEVAAKFTQQAMDLREKSLKRRQQIEQARAAGKDTVSVNNKLVPVAELEAQEAQLQQKAQEALDRAEGVLQRGAVRKAKGAEPKTDKPKVRRVKKDEAKAPTAPAKPAEVLTPAEQAARAWDQATNTIPGAPKWADLTPAQQREFVGYGENNWTRADVVTMLQRAAPAPAAQLPESTNFLERGKFVYHAVRNDEDIQGIVDNGLRPGANVSFGTDGQAFSGEGDTILVFRREDVAPNRKGYQNDGTATKAAKPVAVLKDTQLEAGRSTVDELESQAADAQEEFDRLAEYARREYGLSEADVSAYAQGTKKVKDAPADAQPTLTRLRALSNRIDRLVDESLGAPEVAASAVQVLDRYRRFNLPVRQVSIEPTDDGQNVSLAPAAQDLDARDSAGATSQRERDLRAKSRDTEQPGDVMLATTGKFVSFEDALEAARAAVASGALRPDAPFQYNAVLDIAPRDWNRMVEAMAKPAAPSNAKFGKDAAAGAVKFSKAQNSGGTVDGVYAALSKFFYRTPESFSSVFGGHIRVHQTEAQAVAAVKGAISAREMERAQGFVDPSDSRVVHLIADNIPPGAELAVLLHEVGVHVGLLGQLGANFELLAQQVRSWGKLPKSTLERRVHDAAMARVALGRLDGSISDEAAPEELVAYAAEEAVLAGVQPSANAAGRLASWMGKLKALVESVLQSLLPRKFSMRGLTAQNLVDFAKGAAEIHLQSVMIERGAMPSAKPTEVLNYYAKTAYGEELFDDAKIQDFDEAEPGTETVFWGSESGFGPHTTITTLAETLSEGSESDHPKGFTELNLYITSEESQALARSTGDGNDAVLQTISLSYVGGSGGDSDPAFWSLAVFGPDRGSKLFEVLKSRGQVTELQTADDGYVWTRLESVPMADTISMLSEARRRLTRALEGEVPEVFFVRTTGAKPGKSALMPPAEVARKFSKAPPATQRLPEPLKKPVGTITTILNDTKNLGLNLLTFTEDVMNRAIDLGVESAGRLRTIYQERAALTGKLEREVERVADLYNRVPERERGTGPASVNQFLYDATREGKWGFKPSWRRGPSAAVTLDPDMLRRYGALSKESKALVEAIFRHGDEVLSLKKQTVIDATNSEYDALIAAANKAGDSKKAARLTADKADQLKRFNSLFELQEFRPYAPLRRFGKYVVIARSQAYLDADEKTQRRLEKSEDHYHVSFAESAAAARELVEQLNKQGAFAEVVFREKEAVQQTMFGGTLTAFNKLRSELDSELADAAPGEKAAIRAARKVVGELYLSTLAENSARKSEMRRRGVAGEIDVLRSFTTQGRADARFIAGAKYNGQTLEAFNAMRREVKTGGAEEQNTKSGVFNELMKRHTQSLDYDPTPIASKLARLSTIWYLATSPAYYLQNLTQPFMLSLPVMAGKHNYLKVSNALVKAYTDLAPMFRTAKLGEQFNFDAAPPDVRAAISTLVDRGRIDIGMDTDLGDFQLEGKGPVKDRWNKIDRGIRNAAQKLEAVNRLATAMAAYRLERAKTGDAAKALEYAESIISQTHGDYTALNAPRAFNTATGKVALQFRKFQLIQLTLLTKLVNNTFRGDDRKAAFKALVFTLGHTAVMAGAKGLPGFAAIAWALGMMGGGDDEPFNLEKWLREQAGDPQLATLLTLGVPAALGVDLSSKLGMGNTLSLLPFNDLDLSSRSGVESAAFALFGGPAGGLTLRAADGLSLIRDGQYYRGLEQLMPTGVTNAMRAYRTADEGVTRRNGDLLIAPEEISGMDTFWQAIGFQPTRLAERQFFDKVVRDTDRSFQTRADRIRNAYLRAGDDYEARAEARDRWAELQDAREAAGYRRQPLSLLLRAEQRQNERERNTVGGVQFNRDNRSFVQELIAAEED